MIPQPLFRIACNGAGARPWFVTLAEPLRHLAPSWAAENAGGTAYRRFATPHAAERARVALEAAGWPADLAARGVPCPRQAAEASEQHWTEKTDSEADALFATLSLRELRRRQDLCAAQLKLAYAGHKDRALADLTRMEAALDRAVLARC